MTTLLYLSLELSHIGLESPKRKILNKKTYLLFLIFNLHFSQICVNYAFDY